MSIRGKKEDKLTLEEKDFDFRSYVPVKKEGEEEENSSINKDDSRRRSHDTRNEERLFFSSEGDVLSVKFVQAKLEENNLYFKMDPYCVMKIGTKDLRTRPHIDGCTHPRWNEKFTCEMPSLVCFIFVQIFDKNYVNPDNKIAWTSIPLKSLIKRGPKANVWYDLSGKHGHNKEGQLELITTYTPNKVKSKPEQLLLSVPMPEIPLEDEIQHKDMDVSNSGADAVTLSQDDFNSMGGHLTITCIQAQLVKDYGFDRMDTYCVIKVGSAVLRTKLCRNGSTTPRWGESLNCVLSPGTCIISIEIFNSISLWPDKRIARTSILVKEVAQSGGESTKWYSLSGQRGEDKEGQIQLYIKYSNPSKNRDRQGRVPLDKITTFLNITKIRLPEFTEKVPAKMRIILLGRGGNGKTSVANTILGRQSFIPSDGKHTVQLAKLKASNIEIAVMDTPGFFDQQEMTTEQKTMEIVKTAMDFSEGIHLFVFVCRGDVCFNDDEQKILSELENNYGQSVFDRCLLVLTHANDFLRDNSLEEVLKTNKYLRKVCTLVHGRVIAIENIQNRLSDITMEDQQTQLLRGIFEVVRLQQNEKYTNQFYDSVKDQIVQRQTKHERIVQAYDNIFDKIVTTISSKSENDICTILANGNFDTNEVLGSNNGCPEENIRQCLKWCIKDLQTFINLILTEKRLIQLHSGFYVEVHNHNLIETYKKRSLKTSEAIKANRKKLMHLFNTNVEEKVRSFLRGKELSEIDTIMEEVKKDITKSKIYSAILASLPEQFQSKEWEADVQYLGVQSLNEYLKIKTSLMSDSLLIKLVGFLGVSVGIVFLFALAEVGSVAMGLLLLAVGAAGAVGAVAGLFK